MKEKRKKKHTVRGSVSVLLALVTVPMLVFGSIAADIVTITAARSEADAACELAVNGILSGYHEKLNDYYGLFAVAESAEESALRGLTYLEDCTDPSCAFDRQDLYTLVATQVYGGTDAFSSLLRLTAGDFSVEPATASSPANPTVLENQILAFMKYRGPLVLGENLLERFDVLDTLETKSKTTSAKLKHDDAMAKADDAARALYDTVKVYFDALGAAGLSPDLAAGVEAACTEEEIYLAVESEGALCARQLDGLSALCDAAAQNAWQADDALLALWTEEEKALQRETLLQTVSLRLRVFGIYTSGSADGAVLLSQYMQVQKGKTEALAEEMPEVMAVYSSAIAVRNTAAHLTKREKEMLSSAGIDAQKAEMAANDWIAATEPLLVYLKETGDSLQSLTDDSKSRRAELEWQFWKKVKDCAEKCGAVPGAADTLLEAISSYESSAKTYADLLASLPEDGFKKNLTEEYQQYKVLFDSPAIRELKKQAEDTEALLALARNGPVAATRNAFAAGNPLDPATQYEDSPAGKLLLDYTVRYKDGKQEGDASLLDSIKKLAADSGTEEAKESGNLKSVTEGDVMHVFGLIDALKEADSAADITALAAFGVAGTESSDSEISASTADGLDSVASFFSGFGNVLSGIGDDILEIEYLTEMFSCATDDAKKAVSLTGNGLNISPAFGNELEFLIYGNDTFLANKAAAIAAISAIRFALNTVFVYTDSMTRQTALSIATAVAGWTGFGIPIVQNIVLICWSIVETVADMQKLMKGEGVALIKTEDTWNTSPEGLLRAAEEQTGSTGSESFLDKANCLTYKDYLTLFLTMEYRLNKSEILCRCAKLIQINMNAQEPGFMLTGCWTLAYVTCTVHVKTFFLHSAVSVNPAAYQIHINWDRIGEGTHETTVHRMAVY